MIPVSNLYAVHNSAKMDPTELLEAENNSTPPLDHPTKLSKNAENIRLQIKAKIPELRPGSLAILLRPEGVHKSYHDMATAELVDNLRQEMKIPDPPVRILKFFFLKLGLTEG